MLFPNGITHYVAGGALIGLGTLLIYLFTGIRAGASGVLSASISAFTQKGFFGADRWKTERSWRLVFTIGLIVGAAIFAFLIVGSAWQTRVQWWRLAIGGFLVGIGTRTARGCTSGHGVCGVAAAGRPSIIATVTFVVVAIATALLVQAAGVFP